MEVKLKLLEATNSQSVSFAGCRYNWEELNNKKTAMYIEQFQCLPQFRVLTKAASIEDENKGSLN